MIGITVTNAAFTDTRATKRNKTVMISSIFTFWNNLSSRVDCFLVDKPSPYPRKYFWKNNSFFLLLFHRSRFLDAAAAGTMKNWIIRNIHTRLIHSTIDRLHKMGWIKFRRTNPTKFVFTGSTCHMVTSWRRKGEGGEGSEERRETRE